MHHNRLMKGQPMDAPPRAQNQSLEERFWSSVDKDAEDGHWLWNGLLSTGGYGIIFAAFKSPPPPHLVGRVPYNLLAHRASLMLAGVELGDRDVHHRCYEKLCVNPDHLSLEPQRRNRLILRRGIRYFECPDCGRETTIGEAKALSVTTPTQWEGSKAS